jgi:hypothetical protein
MEPGRRGGSRSRRVDRPTLDCGADRAPRRAPLVSLRAPPVTLVAPLALGAWRGGADGAIIDAFTCAKPAERDACFGAAG